MMICVIRGGGEGGMRRRQEEVEEFGWKGPLGVSGGIKTGSVAGGGTSTNGDSQCHQCTLA